MAGFTRGLRARRHARRWMLPGAVALTVLAGNSLAPPTHVAVPAATADARIAASEPACRGVPMRRGQADIDRHPPGTTFCLSGVHNWTLTPKSGDRLIGPAVLDGQRRTQYAVLPAKAKNVVLSRLEIRNYTVGNQHGAVMSNQWATGWTLRHLKVHSNGTRAGGAGANLGIGWKVLGGRYYNNRQEGLINSIGDNAVIDGAEIDHNNFTDNRHRKANVSCGYDAGGFKWIADNVTVKNSSVHHNACVGLWMDINARGATITNNHVYDNWDIGIFVEISTGAKILGNRVTGNGFRSFRGACRDLWLYGGGITVTASANIEIARNRLAGNCNGITATQENRPDGRPGILRTVKVHHNEVRGPGGKTGAGAYPRRIADLEQRDITFRSNTTSGGMRFCNLNC
jgi:parallel beta-helix repeat protein